jgi:hypothetical protein
MEGVDENKFNRGLGTGAHEAREEGRSEDREGGEC